jgi:broad specificity phosphatase PhoE
VDPNVIERARRTFHGQEAVDEGAPWETVEEVRRRVLATLQRYRHFGTLVVVTHGVVIGSLVGVQRLVDHAEIVPFELEFDAQPEPVRRRALHPLR